MRCLLLSGNSSATKEYFDGTSLFLCERTPDDIAKTVEEIYHSDKALLKARIEKMYEIFNADFSIEVLMRRYQKLSDELVKPGRK